MAKIEGKAWKFGDNVDTDQIIPAERLLSTNLTHLNDFIFEKVRPGFGRRSRKGMYWWREGISAADHPESTLHFHWSRQVSHA